MVSTHITAESRFKINRIKIREVVSEILKTEGVVSDLVVSIAVVGDRKMRKLNRDFHETDATTDVLSFPYLDPQSSRDKGKFVTPDEGGEILGDIVVSYPMAVKQAQKKGVLVDEEINFLVEHGLMHLLGKHHD